MQIHTQLINHNFLYRLLTGRAHGCHSNRYYNFNSKGVQGSYQKFSMVTMLLSELGVEGYALNWKRIHEFNYRVGYDYHMVLLEF